MSADLPPQTYHFNVEGELKSPDVALDHIAQDLEDRLYRAGILTAGATVRTASDQPLYHVVYVARGTSRLSDISHLIEAFTGHWFRNASINYLD